jgi:hypothetical protein
MGEPWVRAQWDTYNSKYHVVDSEFDHKPQWPEGPFMKLLQIAYEDRVILDPNHEVLQRLSGKLL